MVQRFIVLTVLGLPWAAAQAACDAPTKNSDLNDALERSKIAFADLDIDGFKKNMEEADGVLSCLGEPLSLNGAAEFHRISGISLFLGRNSPAAQLSFAAARANQPSYVFPTDLVPEGNPLLDDYGALDPGKGPFEVVGPPAEGSVRLDGSVDLKRNEPLPVIFQLLDEGGAVVRTDLIPGGTTLPKYPMKALGEKPEKGPRSGPNKPLLIGAGAGILVAGGMYGAGLASRKGYDKSDTLEGLDGKRSLTNGLVIGSGVVGAVAIGLGTTSFLVSGTF